MDPYPIHKIITLWMKLEYVGDWRNEQGRIRKEVVVVYLRRCHRIHIEANHDKSKYSLRAKYRSRTSRIHNRTNQSRSFRLKFCPVSFPEAM
jgi:hypothetical protein